MSLTELVIAALATCELIEVWRHSELTATLRSRMEATDSWYGLLLTCCFCLAPWVSVAVVVIMLTSYPWVCLPVYALATARLANLINDTLKAYCLTPKINLKDLLTPEETVPPPESKE